MNNYDLDTPLPPRTENGQQTYRVSSPYELTKDRQRWTGHYIYMAYTKIYKPYVTNIITPDLVYKLHPIAYWIDRY